MLRARVGGELLRLWFCLPVRVRERALSPCTEKKQDASNALWFWVCRELGRGCAQGETGVGTRYECGKQQCALLQATPPQLEELTLAWRAAKTNVQSCATGARSKGQRRLKRSQHCLTLGLRSWRALQRTLGQRPPLLLKPDFACVAAASRAARSEWITALETKHGDVIKAVAYSAGRVAASCGAMLARTWRKNDV